MSASAVLVALVAASVGGAVSPPTLRPDCALVQPGDSAAPDPRFNPDTLALVLGMETSFRPPVALLRLGCSGDPRAVAWIEADLARSSADDARRYAGVYALRLAGKPRAYFLDMARRSAAETPVLARAAVDILATDPDAATLRAVDELRDAVRPHPDAYVDLAQAALSYAALLQREAQLHRVSKADALALVLPYAVRGLGSERTGMALSYGPDAALNSSTLWAQAHLNRLYRQDTAAVMQALRASRFWAAPRRRALLEDLTVRGEGRTPRPFASLEAPLRP